MHSNAGTSRKRTWTDTDDILHQFNHDSESDPIPEVVQVKMALPLRTILIIQGNDLFLCSIYYINNISMYFNYYNFSLYLFSETIKKLFPVDQMLFEVSPNMAAKQVEKLEQDVRGYITAVLNYFSCKYDADGKILISPKGQNPSKKPRRILGNLEQNSELN